MRDYKSDLLIEVLKDIKKEMQGIKIEMQLMNEHLEGIEYKGTLESRLIEQRRKQREA